VRALGAMGRGGSGIQSALRPQSKIRFDSYPCAHPPAKVHEEVPRCAEMCAELVGLKKVSRSTLAEKPMVYVRAK